MKDKGIRVQGLEWLEYIDIDMLKTVLDKTAEVGRMINGLKKYLKGKSEPWTLDPGPWTLNPEPYRGRQ